jgi:nucleotide-binding universal stress UspA family protein
MLDRILLVTDLSADSAGAWDVAIALVQRTGLAELPVLDLAVSPAAYAEIGAPRAAQRLYDDDRRAADEAMKRHVGACVARGIHVRPIVRMGPLAQSMAESIARTAEAELVDLIVLGVRPASVLDRLLGNSLVAQVTRLAPCHVLWIKPRQAK